jgi:hypothetical protein
MPAAIIYLRASTKRQQRNELNLPTQERKCQDWTKHEDIPVLKVFSAAGDPHGRQTGHQLSSEALRFFEPGNSRLQNMVFTGILD